LQVIENSKRKYYTRDKKIKILMELESGAMTHSSLARKHGIHPITLYKWKREMGQHSKCEPVDTRELLTEIEELKKRNLQLQQALGNMAIDNEILKTANDVKKKAQRQVKLKQLKK